MSNHNCYICKPFKRMRFIAAVIFLFSVSLVKAQTYEAGLFIGGSNYIGDVGKTTYISPNDLAVGAIFKWNISKRYSWRASAIYSKISAFDVNSKDTSRQERGYEFENTLKELSIGLEFNFLDFNLHKMRKVISPYLYTGATYTFYDDLYFQGGVVEKNSSRATLAIPMTLGVKTNLTSYLVLGAEIGARYTFTDNLDGSNPKSDALQNNRFGNVLSDDWYVFSGVTLTYTFGRKPCYDCID